MVTDTELTPKRCIVAFSGFVVRLYFSRTPSVQVRNRLNELGASWDSEELCWTVDHAGWKDYTLRREVFRWADDGVKLMTLGLFESLSNTDSLWLRLPTIIPPSEFMPKRIDDTWERWLREDS